MRPAVPLLATLAIALVATACSDDDAQRSDGAYCTEVGNRLADLNTPALATDDDIERVLDSWRAVAAAAPLAVQPDWEVVVDNMETAATVDPNDPESVQRMADAARAGEPAATRVISYTYERCSVLIGTETPVTTTPLQVPPTVDE
ncbi:MAG TPA: hypothetical protein DCR14_01715 [Acidimicrobiaceae bacterium]|nr:hypothetical protein [Acidimicrobiaceae bacterium]